MKAAFLEDGAVAMITKSFLSPPRTDGRGPQNE